LRHGPISETDFWLIDELVDESLGAHLTRGSDRKVMWKCSVGHIFSCSTANRVAGRGCPFCSTSQYLSEIASRDLALANQILVQMRTGTHIEIEGAQYKICTRCGETKSLDCFYVQAGSRDGRKAYCSECGKQASRKWVQAHPEQNREKARIAYRNNPEIGRKRAKDWARKNPLRRREISKKWQVENPEKVRSVTQRRRARLRGALVEKINDLEVFERDSWKCGICNEPIDQKVKYPHPMHAQLDHIVPISKGGSHSWGNVQASHAVCNQRKSNSK
jgi:5-methylcytosine-specific restriction endonuclease McrA